MNTFEWISIFINVGLLVVAIIALKSWRHSISVSVAMKRFQVVESFIVALAELQKTVSAIRNNKRTPHELRSGILYDAASDPLRMTVLYKQLVENLMQEVWRCYELLLIHTNKLPLADLKAYMTMVREWEMAYSSNKGHHDAINALFGDPERSDKQQEVRELAFKPAGRVVDEFGEKLMTKYQVIASTLSSILPEEVRDMKA